MMKIGVYNNWDLSCRQCNKKRVTTNTWQEICCHQNQKKKTTFHSLKYPYQLVRHQECCNECYEKVRKIMSLQHGYQDGNVKSNSSQRKIKDDFNSNNFILQQSKVLRNSFYIRHSETEPK